MRRVYQTRIDELGSGPGNCLQAVVASLLELRIEDVPNFIEDYADPDDGVRRFLDEHGVKITEKPGHVEPPMGGFYFATGMSTQGHEHIVLMRAGAMLHDPNPLGGGLVKITGTRWLEPYKAAAARFIFGPTHAQPAMDAKLTEDDEVVLREIRPNEGVRAWYRDQLQDLARRMACDILRKLRRHYRPASSRLAQDDDPIVVLRTVMKIWGRLWQKRFDDMAKDVARIFADRSQRYLDQQFRKRLRDAGFTVKFKPTERQISAYRAVIAENVNLIRSIPRDFLKDVESSVWANVMAGGTMGALSDSIRKKYGVTYRRASIISRDQVAKAKAVMEQARRAELGIREAEWKHSKAGKVPRPTHLRMDGKRFKIADGMYDSAEGRFVQPGELISCRCTSRSIIPDRLRR